MSFRIDCGESVEEAIRRVAREQIDKAIGEVNDEQLDRHEVVHQVRKRCKKIRGLIRLVRPQFEETYQHENAWYRDSARPLSYVRDAQSIIETFDKLMDHYGRQIDREAFTSVRQQLTERKERIAKDEVGLRNQLRQFRDRMQEGRKRVAAWRMKDEGFDAVEGGLIKTYTRGCLAGPKAYKNPSTENFHQWRKRTKYHWYHMRLLRSLWEGPIKARRDAADALSEDLGDDHDLAIFRQTLLECPEQFGSELTIQTLKGLIDRRQMELRLAAKTLGQRLFAEKPERFAKRIRRYWDAWQCEAKAKADVAHAPELVSAE